MTEASFYNHSGKYDLGRLAAWGSLAFFLGAIMAALYAYGIYYIPWIYVNALLVLGFGFLLSLTITWALRRARVRSVRAFSWSALFLAASAYYIHWAVWIGILLKKADIHEITSLDLALSPFGLWELIGLVNDDGAWSLFGADIRGFWLGCIWLLEAIVIFSFGYLFSKSQFMDIPYCESCQAWCRKEEDVLRISQTENADLIEALRSHGCDPIRSASTISRTEADGTWYQCDLETCPICGETSTLDVSLVRSHTNEKGEVKQKADKLVENMVVSLDDLSLIRQRGAQPAG